MRPTERRPGTYALPSRKISARLDRLMQAIKHHADTQDMQVEPWKLAKSPGRLQLQPGNHGIRGQGKYGQCSEAEMTAVLG